MVVVKLDCNISMIGKGGDNAEFLEVEQMQNQKTKFHPHPVDILLQY